MEIWFGSHQFSVVVVTSVQCSVYRNENSPYRFSKGAYVLFPSAFLLFSFLQYGAVVNHLKNRCFEIISRAYNHVFFFSFVNWSFFSESYKFQSNLNIHSMWQKKNLKAAAVDSNVQIPLRNVKFHSAKLHTLIWGRVFLSNKSLKFSWKYLNFPS